MNEERGEGTGNNDKRNVKRRQKRINEKIKLERQIKIQVDVLARRKKEGKHCLRSLRDKTDGHSSSPFSWENEIHKLHPSEGKGPLKSSINTRKQKKERIKTKEIQELPLWRKILSDEWGRSTDQSFVTRQYLTTVLTPPDSRRNKPGFGRGGNEGQRRKWFLKK